MSGTLTLVTVNPDAYRYVPDEELVPNEENWSVADEEEHYSRLSRQDNDDEDPRIAQAEYDRDHGDARDYDEEVRGNYGQEERW